jgi:SAM-dependent methyltransferase
MSWREAWQEQNTPWDAGSAVPELEMLVEEGALPEGRALIPGCGSGYDVLALAGPDRRALGLDLAEGAAERFRRLRDERGVPAERADIATADFFEFEPDEPFDLVWDYTFLCAIEPEQRERWVERIAEVLKPGGLLVTLIFPVARPGEGPVDPDGGGPPYRMTPDLVMNLLAGTFEKIELREARRSHEGRAGKEWVGRWRNCGR